MSLDAYLAAAPGRCGRCGWHPPTQGHSPTCIAATKADALDAVNVTAGEDTKARVDAAILRLARLGAPFSANDMRGELRGIPGPVVGGRFNAAARRGLIRDTGQREPSNLASTHGHEVRRWVGAA